MNTIIPKTLATRPPYTRQISDASSIEMARTQDRAAAQPLNTQPPRDSVNLSADIFARNPSFSSASPGHDESPRGSTTYAPSFSSAAPQPGILGARSRPRFTRVPSGLRQALSVMADTVGAHWRDLTVGGAITALASWAIWATVKIHKQDNMPYCVFDDAKEL